MEELLKSLGSTYKKVEFAHGYFDVSRIERHPNKPVCISAYITDGNREILPKLVNSAKQYVMQQNNLMPLHAKLMFLNETEAKKFLANAGIKVSAPSH